MKGLGTSKNLKKSYEWYQKAIEVGSDVRIASEIFEFEHDLYSMDDPNWKYFAKGKNNGSMYYCHSQTVLYPAEVGQVKYENKGPLVSYDYTFVRTGFSVLVKEVQPKKGNTTEKIILRRFTVWNGGITNSSPKYLKTGVYKVYEKADSGYETEILKEGIKYYQITAGGYIDKLREAIKR